MRKDNYAARVMIITPHRGAVTGNEARYTALVKPTSQVMVRRHQADGQSISDAADIFGVSRPTFYKAQSALADQGLAGLLPQQRGPKGGHKISVEVIAFVDELKAAKPDLTLPQVIHAIAARFGLAVHRRSLERALTRKKKRLDPP
jgi:transposase